MVTASYTLTSPILVLKLDLKVSFIPVSGRVRLAIIFCGVIHAFRAVIQDIMLLNTFPLSQYVVVSFSAELLITYPQLGRKKDLLYISGSLLRIG